MANIAEQTNIQEMTKQIVQMMERFNENGDAERRKKAESLLKKVHNGEFIAAFCGHFSAGKSTMINALLGENVLPSSPIPTSANLVKIHKAAEEYAVIHYQNERPLLFKAPYDFKKVKELCKSGEVREIELGKRETDLQSGITVMDTPGVDSTDDAHRLATESALHLADVVFYVMDYNHVQSELNFTFTKELLKHGVELYLIINQIDKHKDEELSFRDFESSVTESFASWNVEPKGIFYTSLKMDAHPRNQYQEVKKLIQAAFKEKDKRILKSSEAASHLLLQEHIRWLNEQKENELREYESVLSNYDEKEKAELPEKERKLSQQLEKVRSKEENWNKQFDQELREITKNAYLMPYQVRELAEAFLQSAQPDFKVGFLFGKKKTAQEREERLEAFYQSLKTQVETQLDWHLKEFLLEKIRSADAANEELELQIQNFAVPFERDFLKSTVKPNAMVTGEYVLNYCEEIAEKLKSAGRKKAALVKEKAAEQLKARISVEQKEIELEFTAVSEAAAALRGVNQVNEETQRREDLLYLSIQNPEDRLKFYFMKWRQENQEWRVYTEEETDHLVQSKTEKNHPAVKADAETENQSVSPERVAEKLNHAIGLLKDKEGFKRYAVHLSQKAERLKKQEFTIALFGAFSAGKSSFANALMGEKVLPVSPNPTTAAINRICPPDSVHKHKTAVVYLKSLEQMQEDVRQSLKVFDIAFTDLDSSLPNIQKLISSQEGDGKTKVHFSFLKAFLTGYPEFKSILGHKMETDIAGFQEFVANESKSCFVESIDLYFHSPLAEQGVTLVDTPGADSINARHTGVAFEYIKNSDAILFVTYYNHAFSKADREFLIQLGRVKDSFELDKMFFLVNAVDLADSEEELNDVLSYVNGQLINYGIRFPKLFGVSSLLELQQKGSASGMDHFKEAFNDFLEKELTSMAVQSAEAEFQRGLEMVKAVIKNGRESKEEKELKISQLSEQKEQSIQYIYQSLPDMLKVKVEQEIKELVYYVKQRVFFRFSDFFKESFNPVRIKKNDKKSLGPALDELLESLGFDLSQEMRATTVRLENYVKKLFHERFDQMTGHFKTISQAISLSELTIASMNTPDFPNAFENISTVKLEQAFKYFKNAHAFFEKNEKQLMQDELEQQLKPLADEYLALQSSFLQEHVNTFTDQQFKKMIEEMKADIEEQFAGLLSAYTMEINLDEWEGIRDALENPYQTRG